MAEGIHQFSWVLSVHPVPRPPEMIPQTPLGLPDTFGDEADIIMTSFPNHLRSEVGETQVTARVAPTGMSE